VTAAARIFGAVLVGLAAASLPLAAAQDTTATDPLPADTVPADSAVETPPEAISQERSDTDEAIRNRLQAIFDRVPALADVDVAVEAGIVRLRGTVADGTTGERAVTLAEAQEGVLWVDDGIELTASLGERLEPTWGRLRDLAYGTVALLPLLAVALAIVFASLLAGTALGRWGGPSFLRSRNPFLQNIVGRAIQAAVVLAGILVALELLEATALMFVAYTGYGRIATLGEEVRSPRRTIPRAIIITLLISMVLYLAVGAVGVGAAGVAAFGTAGTERAAPLAVVARGFDVSAAAVVLSVGAITAMLGVLLNLILGLSRVLLAMGRRGDAPAVFGRVDANGRAPVAATIAVGLVVAGIAAVGSIKLAWSFSAFTVLLYYAITNLAAIRLPSEKRLYPRWVAWAGLIGCLGLAWWVEPRVWIAGLAILLVGFVLRWLSRRYAAAILANSRGA